MTYMHTNLATYKTVKPIRKHSTTSYARAKKKAWDAFSVWVRVSQADPEGNARCFTCGGIYPWKQLQAGHYIHGRMDFNEYNVNPQCRRCNKWLSGNLIEYSLQIQKMYGQEILDGLHAQRQALIKYSVPELKEIEEKYKQKVKGGESYV